MEVIYKKIQQILTSSLVTTALALLVLSCVAIVYDGSMICISSVFETFGVCFVLQVMLWFFDRLEFKTMIFDLLLRYTLVIVTVLIGGYIFQWFAKTPIIILVGMAIVIYFLGCVIEVERVKSEIRFINRLIK